jgi:hypothetical protein
VVVGRIGRVFIRPGAAWTMMAIPFRGDRAIHIS